MSKINLNSFLPVNTDYDSPTLQELELLLNRIEELDSRKENETVSSKQAAYNSFIKLTNGTIMQNPF